MFLFKTGKGADMCAKGSMTCGHCLALIYLVASIVVMVYTATPTNVNWGLCVEGDYLWAYVMYFSAVNAAVLICMDYLIVMDTDPDGDEESETVYESMKEALKTPCAGVYFYVSWALLIWGFVLWLSMDKPCADRYAARHPWLLYLFYVDIWFQFLVFMYSVCFYAVFAPAIGLTIYGVITSGKAPKAEDNPEGMLDGPAAAAGGEKSEAESEALLGGSDEQA